MLTKIRRALAKLIYPEIWAEQDRYAKAIHDLRWARVAMAYEYPTVGVVADWVLINSGLHPDPGISASELITALSHAGDDNPDLSKRLKFALSRLKDS